MGEDELKRRVSATLEGFPAWVLVQYEKATHEKEKAALSYIIKRWTELDEEAQKHHLTLHDFSGGGQVLSFRKGEQT